ncbi:class I glutamine amidotransferase-like protein [Pseudoneurospora amorphoporcata]|uniref:Class I glutamine amidotransferase-like protein n=1 Tax=Pseudoneurospora amorphoporcata TaxID=241081 RepID=A0AAN6SIJ3_9PEZI|nr:class I glutamine amidotransferase-like protein [Pseudoneurospora amorphoporcata]
MRLTILTKAITLTLLHLHLTTAAILPQLESNIKLLKTLPKTATNLGNLKTTGFPTLANNTNSNSTTYPAPKTYALLLFRSFEILDAYGPIEILQFVAKFHPLRLLIFSRSFPGPVLTSPTLPSMNPQNSSFYPIFNPTHAIPTTEQQWNDMREVLESVDVLMVPGGEGVYDPDLEAGGELAFLRRMKKKDKYLVTVCIGSAVVARAGVLDGRRATTNKMVWGEVTPLGEKVKWVSPARWVVDGNIWTSSGVTSGLDMTFEFVRHMYPDGVAMADLIAGAIEHEPVMDWRDDPFAERFGIPPQN